MSQTTAVLIAKVRDQNVSRWTKAINISASQAGMAIAAMGVIAFVAMNKIANYGASIYDLASATGVSMEGVQALGYAFEQTGGSSSSMGGAIRGLNTFMRTAATGSKEYMDALSGIGLEYDTLRAMTPEAAFLTITDAIGGVDSAMERNIVATTIFGGRYAQQVTGALDQAGGSLRTLTEQFEETGNAMSGEQITSLKHYADAMTDLQYQFKKLMADGLIPLMPAMQDFLEQLANGASSIAPEAIVVLQGLSTTLIGLAKFVIGLADGIANLNTNASTFGGTMNWMVSPVTAAAGTIIKFVEAAAEADAALAEWEDAADSAATSQAAATLITALYSDAMEGNAQALGVLTSELEKLEAQGADTLGVLDNLHAEQERLANIEAALTMQTGTLTSSTEGLTLEQVELERSAVNAAIMLLELENVMAVGPTTIAAQIAALREYSTELGILGAGFGAAASGGGGAVGKLDVKAHKEDLKAILEAEQEALAEVVQMEAMHQQRVAERIEAEKQAELLRIQEVAEIQAIADADKAAASAKSLDQMVAFGSAVYDAAVNGKVSWKDFWADMGKQLLKIVAMKGFKAILNLATGGGSGVIGGLMSFLGFSGGGPVPGQIHSASGGIVAGGRLGDRTLIAATPGERVLSRQERVAYESGMNRSSPDVIVNFQSTLGPYSAATQAELGPFLADTLRKMGVTI